MPDWLRLYREAAGGSEEGRRIVVEDEQNFARILTPLLSAARRRLVDGLPADRLGRDVPAEDDLVAMLADTLLPMLHAMLGRAVVLELNVARVRGELAPDLDRAGRYRGFLQRLGEADRARRFLEDRPVLPAVRSRQSDAGAEHGGRGCRGRSSRCCWASVPSSRCAAPEP